jgi:hypothetical protein
MVNRNLEHSGGWIEWIYLLSVGKLFILGF